MTDEEKKINEAIKQDGIDTQSEILEELKRCYPQYVEHVHSEQETVTNEQIEKALRNADDIPISDDVDCCDVLAYINRLKRDKERIKKNWKIAVSVQRAKWQAKVRYAGKDTAKEILQDWYDDIKVRLGEDGNYIINYAKKYGVEIDE